MKLKTLIVSFSLLLTISNGIAQVGKAPYSEDIQRFKKLDSLTPPLKHAILFIGSSSFTLWKDVQDYFPGYPVINRAYGGSRLTDQIRDVNDIVFPCNPKQVVIYCGENDFASDDTLSAPVVTGRFKQLFNLIRLKLPDVKVTYVSMKPSPSRWRLETKYVAANRGIRKFLRKQRNTSFVNIWGKMLAKNHMPKPDIFLDDQLHMNSTGYGIWQKAIRSHLIK